MTSEPQWMLQTRDIYGHDAGSQTDLMQDGSGTPNHPQIQQLEVPIL